MDIAFWILACVHATSNLRAKGHIIDYAVGCPQQRRSRLAAHCSGSGGEEGYLFFFFCLKATHGRVGKEAA
eukprot:1552-Heterococcus_DN1.PRE.5